MTRVLMFVLLTQVFHLSAAAQHPNYQFTRIATSLEPEYEFFQDEGPKITEVGKVLFFARIPATGDDGAYFFGDADSQEMIVAWNASFGSLHSPRQINDSGDFVFIEDFGPTPNELYHWTSEQGVVVLYAGTGGPDSLRFIDSDQPSINNDGDVVFIADGQGFGSDTVFQGSLKGELPVDVVASIFDGFSRFHSVYISDSGEVIARGERYEHFGIYKFNDSRPIQTIATTADEFEQVTDFDANCNGQVLFVGTVDGVKGLYFGDESGLELVTQQDPSFVLLPYASVNDHGDLCFLVRVEGDPLGGSTLQIGPDLVQDRLIGAGDSLHGDTIRTISAGRGCINNRGQIVFRATWTSPSNGDDVHSGIILATPEMSGDVNGDGQVNLLDVAPFVDLLASGGYLSAADINGDGSVDLLDVDLFVDLLVG